MRGKAGDETGGIGSKGSVKLCSQPMFFSGGEAFAAVGVSFEIQDVHLARGLGEQGPAFRQQLCVLPLAGEPGREPAAAAGWISPG